MQSVDLKIINTEIYDYLDKKKEALPKDLNQVRFVQNAMSVISTTENIGSISKADIVTTIFKGALLGLDFFNKECYALVINKNVGDKKNPRWIKSLEFRTDYKGEIKLARKYSYRKIKDIYAKNVRLGDEFVENIVNGQQSLNFLPKPFSTEEIVGAFAVVMYEDGGMSYETMSRQEIDDIRLIAKTDFVWIKHYGEMAKKTVLRRLCKHIQWDFENQEQNAEYYNASEVNLENKKEDTSKKEVETSLDFEQEKSIPEAVAGF